jgi:hypothetical protein
MLTYMWAKFRFLERVIVCKITAKFYKINTADMEFIYTRI